MKIYIGCIASLFSLSLCLAMEQDQKKVKTEENQSSSIRPYTIPSLVTLVLQRIAEHELGKNETLPLLYATLKETYKDVPSHLIIPLMDHLVNKNAVRQLKYDSINLFLTLAEYLMERSVREALDTTIQKKSYIEKVAYIQQKAKHCKCQQGCSLEHTALNFIHTFLDYKFLDDMGQLRPLARSALFKYPLTLRYLVAKSSIEEQRQALKQLLYAKNDQGACELIALLPQTTLFAPFAEGLGLANYAQAHKCTKALNLLTERNTFSSLGYTQGQIFYPNPAVQEGFLVGNTSVVSNFIKACQQTKPPISLNSIRLKVNISQDIYPLLYALSHGYKGIATLLIESGIDCTIKDQDKNTPLHLACDREDLEIVKLLLSKGDPTCINTYSALGLTPLHLACLKDNRELAELLLDNGAGVNLAIVYDPTVNTYRRYYTPGATPLHIACHTGSIALIELLLKRGAQLPIRNTANESAFSIACSKNDTNLIQLLLKYGLEQGVAINSLIDMNCLNSLLTHDNIEMLQLLLKHIPPPARFLHSACKRSNASLVKLLLEEYHLPLDTKDDKENTALHSACSSAKGIEIVPLLLEKAQALFLKEYYLPYINAKNNTGLTPFLVACQSGNNDLIKYLLATEGFVTKDKQALSLYVEGADLLELSLVESLFTSIEDVNEQDDKGKTILHKLTSIITPGRDELMQLLLNKGAYSNIADQKGNTPLHTECKKGALPIMTKLLLDNGAYVNLKNNEGKTPFHLNTLDQGHSLAEIQKIAELLLTKGATINAIDKEGNTPLHYACRESLLEIVAFLLSHGALPTIKNTAGKTPLDFAQESNNPALIELFAKHTTQQSNV
jgi:ankyrin repeat protein